MATTDSPGRSATRPETDGAELRRLRYQRGWTIGDVVNRLIQYGRPVHENHLRSVEAGRKNASAPLLFALAVILDAKVEELLVTEKPAQR